MNTKFTISLSIFDEEKFLASVGAGSMLGIRNKHLIANFFADDVEPEIARLGTITILDQHGPHIPGGEATLTVEADVDVYDQDGFKKAWSDAFDSAALAEPREGINMQRLHADIDDLARELFAVTANRPAPLDRGFEFATPPEREQVPETYLLATAIEGAAQLDEMVLHTFDNRGDLLRYEAGIEDNNSTAYPDARISTAAFVNRDGIVRDL